MITRIHVNQHNIRWNKKWSLGVLNDFLNVGKKPVFTVKTYKENKKCNRVVIKGPSELVYSPDKPLSCGATAWIETHSEVECD